MRLKRLAATLVVLVLCSPINTRNLQQGNVPVGKLDVQTFDICHEVIRNGTVSYTKNSTTTRPNSQSEVHTYALLEHSGHRGDCSLQPVPVTRFPIDWRRCPPTMDANCNCLNGRNGPFCSCSSGELYDIAAKACKDINACTFFPCKRGAADVTCTDLTGAPNTTVGRTCSCGAGYAYSEAGGCDIDACLFWPCTNGAELPTATCNDITGATNSSSGRTCTCPAHADSRAAYTDASGCPQCTGNPTDPDYGTFSCDPTTLPGANCTAMCDDGYWGLPTAICQPDGTWSDIQRTCQPAGPVVTAGFTHTCFIKSVPGAAVCVGKFRAWPFSSFPISAHLAADVPAPYKATLWSAIGAGYDFTCGLTADLGALICWGSNELAYQSVPNFSQGWDRLFVGSSGVCALPYNSQSALSCWGETNLAPPSINLGDVWISVDVGDGFACGIVESPTISGAIRQLRCWGDNRFGQTNAPAGLTDWRSVSLGNSHGCAIHGRGRQMLCWGDAGTQLCQTAGCDNPGSKSWAQVSAGYYHTCGIRWDDDRMECWGVNRGYCALDVDPRDAYWSSVSVGLTHTCGVTAGNNTFHCWGCFRPNLGQTAVPNMA